MDNACGSIVQFYSFRSRDCSTTPCPTSDKFSVSPNSSASTFNIAIPNVPPPPPCDPTSSPTAVKMAARTEQGDFKIQTLELYGADGLLKQSWAYTADTRDAQIDLSGLRNGNYVLKIIDGDYTETHHIIKKE